MHLIAHGLMGIDSRTTLLFWNDSVQAFVYTGPIIPNVLSCNRPSVAVSAQQSGYRNHLNQRVYKICILEYERLVPVYTKIWEKSFCPNRQLESAKPMRFFIALGALATLITGCGGSGGTSMHITETNSTSMTMNNPPQARNYKIVILGNYIH